MRVITEDQNKDRQKILAETVDYLYKTGINSRGGIVPAAN